VNNKQVTVPVKMGEQTLKALLLGAFEAWRKAGLGVAGGLSPLFREKGLNGRLLAFVSSHLGTLETQLAATIALEPHRLEDVPAGDLSEQQFRALLAHYYRQAIRMIESEAWPEEVVHGPDQAFIQHLMEIRDRDLAEMAATMVELETGSASARKVTAEAASWKHLCGEIGRLLAEQGIAFAGAGTGTEAPDVLSRVRMAFILTLVKEEAQSRAANTLLGFLHQVQDLGQSGIEEGLIGRIWLLPSEIPHEKMESRDEDSARHLDFTSLQAIVCRWRELLRGAYPKEVVGQLCLGNWNSALGLLRGDPHLFVELKSRILEMVRLQMPFGDVLEVSASQERIRLPFAMEVIFRAGEGPRRMAVASEVLMLLGSRACYPLLFSWAERAGRRGCLEIVDTRPGQAPLNGAHHEMALEMILLRVFCQAWGIEGRPTAADFANPVRLMRTPPRGMDVEAGLVGEIREVLNLHRMSTALSRVESVLDRTTLQLRRASGEAVKGNVRGLRRLMKKAGVRRSDAGTAGTPAVSTQEV
jgi:hypothetical protein